MHDDQSAESAESADFATGHHTRSTPTITGRRLRGDAAVAPAPPVGARPDGARPHDEWTDDEWTDDDESTDEWPDGPDDEWPDGPDREWQDDADDLFDQPSRWRAQAARTLGLRGDDLLAAVSPGVACPMVLRSVLAGVEAAGRVEVLVDIGCGTGGISEWLRQRTGASVVAIEPSPGARQAAASLFPAVSVRPGTAASTGLVDGIADAAVICGVVSLIDDLGPVLDEMERIVRPGGSLALADLFASAVQPITSAPNRFHGVEQLTAALAVRGWRIDVVGCGTASSEHTWADGVARVDGWIHRHRSDHPAYARWVADRDHLARHVASGDLVAACLVARR